MKSKIGWCNATWNPVWGCLNKCPYCYARRIAKIRCELIAGKEYRFLYWNYGLKNFCRDEFANRLRHFIPTFIQSNFNTKFPKKSQKIFVGSMSEIRFWKKEWIKCVFESQILFPEHIFQYLTKYPYIYHRLEFPAKSWLGFTATTNKELANGMPHIEKLRSYSLTGKYLYFVSIEPILEKINPLGILFLDWVILGAETGNRKGKIIPRGKWIDDIVLYCRDNNIPIYLKDSLKDIYPVEIKEFPNYK